VDVGYSHFTGAGQGVVRLTPGTLVLVPAQRVHACNPEPGKAWSYQMLHLDADWLRCLRLESGMAAGEPLAPARITRSPALYRQFCALNELLFSKVSPLEKEAALVAFIGDHDLSTLPTLPPAPALALRCWVSWSPASTSRVWPNSASTAWPGRPGWVAIN
jgi:hypothetical protein